MSPYASTRLSNGLQVLTYSDEHCPVVYINVFVRAGYRYETLAERGNAHFLEHMLLKGTAKFPTPDKVAEQVNRVGGYQNARTNSERVLYEIEVAREYVEPMLALLRDMLFDSLLDPTVLENEKRIILEEYNANRIDHNQFFARSIDKTFYAGHPLGNSSLDADDATRAATPETLRDYLRQWS